MTTPINPYDSSSVTPPTSASGIPASFSAQPGDGTNPAAFSWQQWLPGATPEQIQKFQEQLCRGISQQIARENARMIKEMQRMKRQMEGK